MQEIIFILKDFLTVFLTGKIYYGDSKLNISGFFKRLVHYLKRKKYVEQKLNQLSLENRDDVLIVTRKIEIDWGIVEGDLVRLNKYLLKKFGKELPNYFEVINKDKGYRELFKLVCVDDKEWIETPQWRQRYKFIYISNTEAKKYTYQYACIGL